MISKLLRRLRYLRDRRERRRLLEEEIRFHLEQHTEELVEAGTPRAEAETLARLRFGNPSVVREEARAIWIAHWAEDFWQDLRFAWRSLARQPGFAAAAILSAALGIGACSTIFAIAGFALFQPIAGVAEPDRVVNITASYRSGPGGNLSYPELVELRERRHSLASVSAVFPLLPANIGADKGAYHHWGWVVSANYFETLGMRAHLGRTFSVPQDDQPGAPPAVVLSYELWRGRFGGDASHIGREIEINGQRTTLIGVAPPGFRGHQVALIADFWVPISALDRIRFPKGGFSLLTNRGNDWLLPVARLRPGVSLEEARADLAVLANQLCARFPERKDRGFHIERAGQVQAGGRQILARLFAVLAGAAALVLLIACVNVANLLLARASGRQREISTRLAIGAGRFRLIRQLLTESLLLASVGGACGIALAHWGTALIGRFELPIRLPVEFAIRVDYRVVLFAATLSVATGLAFGLAPALHATRRDPAPSLKTARHPGAGSLLMVAQVAICAMLLLATGLFLRSLIAARDIDTGLSARNVLFLNIDPVANRYSFADTRRFFETLAARVATLPGVEAASYTNLLPLSFITASGNFLPEQARSNPAARPIHVQAVLIGPRYFETLGIPLLAGRDFGAERPDGELVVIVNQDFARRAFPGSDALGRRIFHGKDAFRIIGVAANAKVRTIGEGAEPQVYQPVSQMIEKEDMPLGLTLAVRTSGQPALWLAAVKEQVAALDRSLAVFEVKTMQGHLRSTLLLPRLAALLFGICGGMGLLIAAIGLYGVISYAVAQRTREIGIRMAIGARPREILGMMLRSGFTLALTGVAIGVGLALPVARLASSLLYGIGPWDAPTFAAVPAFLLLVALTASFLPARRAARLDPMTTLRDDG